MRDIIQSYSDILRAVAPDECLVGAFNAGAGYTGQVEIVPEGDGFRMHLSVPGAPGEKAFAADELFPGPHETAGAMAGLKGLKLDWTGSGIIDL